MVRSSTPQAQFVSSFAELDPWGAEVYRSDPYISDPQFSGGRGESGPVFPGFGDLSMGSRGCMLDGVYTLCDFLDRNRDALARLMIEGGKTKVFNLNGGALGVFAVWIEDAGEKLQKPQTPIDADISADDVIVTNTDSDGLGHWELISIGSELMSLGPQNTAFDITGITNQVDAILANLRCVEFGKRILSAVSTKDNPALRGGDLREIFDDFLLQQNGGFTRTMPPGSAGYGSPTGLISKQNGMIFSPAYSHKTRAEQTEYDAGTIVAELFHLAGRNKTYTDRALAEAVYSIPEYASMSGFSSPTVFDPGYEDKKGAMEKPNHMGWSSYFHDIQRKVCAP